MSKKRFLIYVFLVFLIMIIENVEASHVSGNLPTHARQIKVKLDLGDDELFNFQFIDTTDRNRICYVELIEEDDTWGDDEGSARGVAGKIIKYQSGGLNIALANDVCSGVYGDNECGVRNKQWDDSMSSQCGVCTLAQSNTKYRPKGDILCSSDEYWYLCDSTFAGKAFTLGNIRYECTTNNEWRTIEICNNQNQDDDGDNTADCIDTNCFSTASADILNFNRVDTLVIPNIGIRYANPYCNPNWNQNVCESQLSLDYDTGVTQTYSATCNLLTGTSECAPSPGTLQIAGVPICVCPSGQTKTPLQCFPGGCFYTCTGTANPSFDCTSQRCPTGYQCNIPAPSNACCGDSSADFGFILESGAICGLDASNRPVWSTQQIGQIQYINGYEYISDGTNWIKCDINFATTGNPSKIEINGHDYVCKGRGQNSIVECCGPTGQCNSDGAQLFTGASINPSNIVQQPGICELSTGYDECFYTTDDTCVCPYGQNRESEEQCYQDQSATDRCNQDYDSCYSNCDASDTTCQQSCSDALASCLGDVGLTCGIFYFCNGIAQSIDCRTQPDICPDGYDCNIPPIPPSTTYYCNSDGKFIPDLDLSQAACEDPVNNFKWTGTSCCGDDANEDYNDPGPIGGCWNSGFVSSGSKVSGTSDVVLNSVGQFYGCNSNVGKSGLVIESNFCTVDGQYFCNSTGRWELTNSVDRSELKNQPLGVTASTGCCAQSQCWNGNECVNEQSDPSILPINGYKCFVTNGVGEWSAAILKYSPDDSTSGYCTSNLECFTSSGCVQDGYYDEDDYCENGDWSTRTKLLAVELLKIKDSASADDYTLFCDNKENTANYLNYYVPNTGNILVVLNTNLNANNFCVLTYGNDVVVATSINNKITSTSSSVFSNIRNVFSAGSCSNSDILNSDGEFHDCNSTQTNKLWINNRTRSIIYSKNKITVGTDPGSFAWVKDSIGWIIETIKRVWSSELTPEKTGYLDKVNRFDRLYIAVKDLKSIKGSLYSKFSNTRTAAIEYSGFTATNVCEIVNEYGSRITKSSNTNAMSEISCRPDGNKHYVLVQGSISTASDGDELTGINPDEIWPDLTSKLRLR